MTKKLLGAAGLSLALLAGGAALAQNNQAMTGQMDSAQLRDWLNKLHAGNQMEIQAARLASEKSSDPDVKQFAQHMLSEHSQMDQQILALAKERGINLSSKPAASFQDAKKRAAMQKLKAKSGADFDRSYAQMMVQDHQDDVKDVSRMASQAPDRDPTVKQMLTDARDKMQHHLQMAESTRQAVNEEQSPTRQGRRP